jgi:hypothetical protein
MLCHASFLLGKHEGHVRPNHISSHVSSPAARGCKQFSSSVLRSLAQARE